MMFSSLSRFASPLVLFMAYRTLLVSVVSPFLAFFSSYERENSEHVHDACTISRFATLLALFWHTHFLTFSVVSSFSSKFHPSAQGPSSAMACSDHECLYIRRTFPSLSHSSSCILTKSQSLSFLSCLSNIFGLKIC